MAEHWISAATALRLVSRGPYGVDSLHSLCARAHTGLVKTKARLFTRGNTRAGTRQENAPVPPAFWWARGHEALEQNWHVGDFSTWIEERERLQAFGVTFALSDVSEMLPAERRALVARELSVAGDAAWMPARQAVLLARKAPGITSGPEAILEHARLGFLSGRAVLAQRFDGPVLSPDPSWEEREWDVPDWFWQGLLVQGRSSQDWERGRFHAEGSGPNGNCLMRLSGLYLLTESVQMLMPSAMPTPPPVESVPAGVPTKAGAGGRPPQPWWDDLWCAVWGLIYQGAFIPKTQADVEKAMLTWATTNGHEVSEAAVRPKARKLFQTYKGEATNFLAG